MNTEDVHDSYGNRTNVAATGTAADSSPIPLDGIPNLAYDNETNRITTTGYEYDAAGNQVRALSADGVNWLLYEYDAANRLRAVKKDDTNQTSLQAFQYGSTNARVMALEHATGQWTIFAAIGGSVLAEYTEFNHPDRLGTKVITNQVGGTSYEQATLPFGTALNAESTVTDNNKRFTSYDRSAPTGLDYAINRTYDSKQGRFTQVDPIGFQASDVKIPQSLNLYSYCGNDPINQTDSLGLFWIGKLFSFFKKIGQIIMNIVKMAVFVMMVVMVVATYGAFLGFVIAIALAVVPHLIGIVAKKQFIEILKSPFAKMALV